MRRKYMNSGFILFSIFQSILLIVSIKMMIVSFTYLNNILASIFWLIPVIYIIYTIIDMIIKEKKDNQGGEL
jgi:hypothetical protein